MFVLTAPKYHRRPCHLSPVRGRICDDQSTFERLSTRQIAVKVINQYGDEVMPVYPLRSK